MKEQMKPNASSSRTPRVGTLLLPLYRPCLISAASRVLIDHVTKTHGEKQVLTDISLHVPAGQIRGLLGAMVRARPRCSAC